MRQQIIDARDRDAFLVWDEEVRAIPFRSLNRITGRAAPDHGVDGMCNMAQIQSVYVATENIEIR